MSLGENDQIVESQKGVSISETVGFDVFQTTIGGTWIIYMHVF